MDVECSCTWFIVLSCLVEGDGQGGSYPPDELHDLSSARLLMGQSYELFRKSSIMINEFNTSKPITNQIIKQ